MLSREVNAISREVSALEAENARLKQMIVDLSRKFEESDKPKACKHCKFFVRHYIKWYGQYSMTEMGHCVHGRRMKGKKSGDSCDFFELGTRD